MKPRTSSGKLGRVLVVTDGEKWFVRSVACTEHNANADEMVYRCDSPIGGAYDTIDEAATVARKWADPSNVEHLRTEQPKIPEQNGETSAPVQADAVTYGPDDRRALSGSRSSAGRPGPESAALPPSDVTVPMPAADGRFICGTCFGSGAGNGPRGARGWCKSCGGDGTVHEEAKAHRRTVGTANPSPERLQILLDDARQGCAKLVAERVRILKALGLLTEKAADAGLWEEEHVLAEIRRLRAADVSCVTPCRPESTGSQRRCEAHDLPLYPDGWCKEGRKQ